MEVIRNNNHNENNPIYTINHFEPIGALYARRGYNSR